MDILLIIIFGFLVLVGTIWATLLTLFKEFRFWRDKRSVLITVKDLPSEAQIEYLMETLRIQANESLKNQQEMIKNKKTIRSILYNSIKGV